MVAEVFQVDLRLFAGLQRPIVLLPVLERGQLLHQQVLVDTLQTHFGVDDRCESAREIEAHRVAQSHVEADGKDDVSGNDGLLVNEVGEEDHVYEGHQRGH